MAFVCGSAVRVNPLTFLLMCIGTAQRCVHPIPGNPGNEQPGPWWWDPQRQCAGVGDGRIRMLPRPIAAFSGRLRGLKLVPSKWRYLVPPTSTPQGHNASR